MWSTDCEHGHEVWSTQVRLVLPELLFEVIFVLDRQSDAWREELECGARSKSWSME